MAVYAIGDIQGCYDEFRKLLDLIKFDPSKDKIWLAGDLVNRGPKNAEVLRFARSLGKRAKIILGNHDLHLLAMAYGVRTPKANDTARSVLDAPDSAELIQWLRQQPLLHHSKKRQWTMVHAGIPPQWSLEEARRYAHEVEAIIKGDNVEKFLKKMYGNAPSHWSNDLENLQRHRYIINAFTRMRFCKEDGSLEFASHMKPDNAPDGLTPWFRFPERKTQGNRIAFGHWSTAGYKSTEDIAALDTGCIWGGSLTAIRIRKRKAPPTAFHLSCA